MQDGTSYLRDSIKQHATNMQCALNQDLADCEEYAPRNPHQGPQPTVAAAGHARAASPPPGQHHAQMCPLYTMLAATWPLALLAGMRFSRGSARSSSSSPFKGHLMFRAVSTLHVAVATLAILCMLLRGSHSRSFRSVQFVLQWNGLALQAIISTLPFPQVSPPRRLCAPPFTPPCLHALLHFACSMAALRLGGAVAAALTSPPPPVQQYETLFHAAEESSASPGGPKVPVTPTAAATAAPSHGPSYAMGGAGAGAGGVGCMGLGLLECLDARLLMVAGAGGLAAWVMDVVLTAAAVRLYGMMRQAARRSNRSGSGVAPDSGAVGGTGPAGRTGLTLRGGYLRPRSTRVEGGPHEQEATVAAAQDDRAAAAPPSERPAGQLSRRHPASVPNFRHAAASQEEEEETSASCSSVLRVSERTPTTQIPGSGSTVGDSRWGGGGGGDASAPLPTSPRPSQQLARCSLSAVAALGAAPGWHPRRVMKEGVPGALAQEVVAAGALSGRGGPSQSPPQEGRALAVARAPGSRSELDMTPPRYWLPPPPPSQTAAGAAAAAAALQQAVGSMEGSPAAAAAEFLGPPVLPLRSTTAAPGIMRSVLYNSPVQQVTVVLKLNGPPGVPYEQLATCLAGAAHTVVDQVMGGAWRLEEEQEDQEEEEEGDAAAGPGGRAPRHRWLGYTTQVHCLPGCVEVVMRLQYDGGTMEEAELAGAVAALERELRQRAAASGGDPAAGDGGGGGDGGSETRPAAAASSRGGAGLSSGTTTTVSSNSIGAATAGTSTEHDYPIIVMQHTSAALLSQGLPLAAPAGQEEESPLVHVRFTPAPALLAYMHPPVLAATIAATPFLGASEYSGGRFQSACFGAAGPLVEEPEAVAGWFRSGEMSRAIEAMQPDGGGGGASGGGGGSGEEGGRTAGSSGGGSGGGGGSSATALPSTPRRPQLEPSSSADCSGYCPPWSSRDGSGAGNSSGTGGISGNTSGGNSSDAGWSCMAAAAASGRGRHHHHGPHRASPGLVAIPDLELESATSADQQGLPGSGEPVAGPSKEEAAAAAPPPSRLDHTVNERQRRASHTQLSHDSPTGDAAAAPSGGRRRLPHQWRSFAFRHSRAVGGGSDSDDDGSGGGGAMSPYPAAMEGGAEARSAASHQLLWTAASGPLSGEGREAVQPGDLPPYRVGEGRGRLSPAGVGVAPAARRNRVGARYRRASAPITALMDRMTPFDLLHGDNRAAPSATAAVAAAAAPAAAATPEPSADTQAPLLHDEDDPMGLRPELQPEHRHHHYHQQEEQQQPHHHHHQHHQHQHQHSRSEEPHAYAKGLLPPPPLSPPEPGLSLESAPVPSPSRHWALRPPESIFPSETVFEGGVESAASLLLPSLGLSGAGGGGGGGSHASGRNRTGSGGGDVRLDLCFDTDSPLMTGWTGGRATEDIGIGGSTNTSDGGDAASTSHGPGQWPLLPQPSPSPPPPAPLAVDVDVRVVVKQHGCVVAEVERLSVGPRGASVRLDLSGLEEGSAALVVLPYRSAEEAEAPASLSSSPALLYIPIAIVPPVVASELKGLMHEMQLTAAAVEGPRRATNPRVIRARAFTHHFSSLISDMVSLLLGCERVAEEANDTYAADATTVSAAAADAGGGVLTPLAAGTSSRRRAAASKRHQEELRELGAGLMSYLTDMGLTATVRYLLDEIQDAGVQIQSGELVGEEAVRHILGLTLQPPPPLDEEPPPPPLPLQPEAAAEGAPATAEAVRQEYGRSTAASGHRGAATAAAGGGLSLLFLVALFVVVASVPLVAWLDRGWRRSFLRA